MTQLNVYGNHRGGTSIALSLPASAARRFDDWRLADPKEGRSELLAREVSLRHPGTRALALQEPARRAHLGAASDASVVLALDTVRDTAEVLDLRRADQRTTFQLVGRGPGGNGATLLGLQGTVLPGDASTAGQAALLLETLDVMAAAASSRALTSTDPLTASLLGPMRAGATRQTVRHLAEAWDRDELPGGALSVAFGVVPLPLVVLPLEGALRYSLLNSLAVEAVGSIPLGQRLDRGPLGRQAAVALVAPRQAVHFVTVRESTTGRRRVEGVSTLQRVPDVARQLPGAQPATFTD